MTEPVRHLVVVYHENCIDGLASAWALHQKWGLDPGTVMMYVAYAHHKPGSSEKSILDALKPGTELYFVDVAPEKGLLDDLLSPDASGGQKLASVHVLDHHRTAAANLAQYKPLAISGFTPPALELQLHENHPSAAKMIWHLFLPGTATPAFLEMIDKMDRNANMNTMADFAAAALIDSMDIASITEAFNTCSALSKLTHDQMIREGQKILDDQKIRIEKLNDNVMHTEIEILPGSPPIRVPIVNADVQNFGRFFTNYLQDLGHQSGTGVSFAWYVQGNGAVTMSIRTNGTPDASKIAEHFHKKPGISGGGHKTSAAVHFASLEHFCEHVPLQPAKNRRPIRIRRDLRNKNSP